jgi:alkanesulfonate monooxygenase SsuD/methylene tetrahydromethanopterin reductase-like flavin-dependent oxidoreductase (luciferase family)
MYSTALSSGAITHRPSVAIAHRRIKPVKDYIAAMKVLWRDKISEYHGRYVNFPPVRCYPKPVSKPHPPVLIGSINNSRALKRVAEWGDGWIPVVASVDEFADGITKIKGMAKEAGRDPSGLDFTVSGSKGNGRRARRFRNSRRWERTGSWCGWGTMT